MSIITEPISIKKLLDDVRELYHEVAELSDEDLAKIQLQFDKKQRNSATNKYLVVVICATLFFLIMPFFIYKIWLFFTPIVPFLIEQRAELSTSNIEVINISLSLGIFAFPVYLLMPFIQNTRIGSISLFATFGTLNKKQDGYVFTLVIGAYFILGLLGLALYCNSDLVRLVSQISTIYLIIPVVFGVAYSVMNILVLLLLYPYRKANQKNNRLINGRRIDICIRLMQTLKVVGPMDNFYFVPSKDLQEIINQLLDIRLMIKNFPAHISVYLQRTDMKDDFAKASIEFEKTLALLVNTGTTHASQVKGSLVNYLNIFLTGDLSLLPKADELMPEKNLRKAKAIHYIYLGFYLILPIIILVILKVIFKITLDEYTQSLIRIVYIVWAFLGIFSNPFFLSNENKDLLKDIFKTIMGKG